MTVASQAAAEIGLLVNHILALAPDAGLYVSIKIEPRQQLLRERADADGAGGRINLFHGSAVK